MTPWLDDGDVRLYHGDVLDVLRELPDESVDCVVTSPPYWGLRDYGTGEWDGGDPDCDHIQTKRTMHEGRQGNAYGTPPGAGRIGDEYFKDVCGKCGARRGDRQMGLEPTPDLFVQNMVEVFREVRRVLADHGTCWVNLGDAFLDKQLVGAPWRVAFALQADGWYLRSDIVWAKPNPMPESVTDRPTKAHEYVFLLTKRPRYWFDAEAVREPHAEILSTTGKPAPRARYGGSMPSEQRGEAHLQPAVQEKVASGDWRGFSGSTNPNGRNVRSVWQIATQPYPEAHFATFPEGLARRCIVAGCPQRVCRVCGKPSERIVERELHPVQKNFTSGAPTDGYVKNPAGHIPAKQTVETVGWSDCGHNNWRPGQVLDPFIGSGTVAKVARDHQRHAIGIDLSANYLQLAARRLQQLSLLNEAQA